MKERNKKYSWLEKKKNPNLGARWVRGGYFGMAVSTYNRPVTTWCSRWLLLKGAMEASKHFTRPPYWFHTNLRGHNGVRCIHGSTISRIFPPMFLSSSILARCKDSIMNQVYSGPVRWGPDFYMYILFVWIKNIPRLPPWVILLICPHCHFFERGDQGFLL